jgi:hypothetical protein
MGSWPEGVPLPPKPEKPEGITEDEWQVYLNNDPLMISPAIRDKVERALGWKTDDVAAAQEIAERVLGAVKIVETESAFGKLSETGRVGVTPDGKVSISGRPASGKGHVPEENLHRYRRTRELAHLLSRMGDMVSNLGEHGDANTLWALGGKYKRMANELRADLPAETREEEQ